MRSTVNLSFVLISFGLLRVLTNSRVSYPLFSFFEILSVRYFKFFGADFQAEEASVAPSPRGHDTTVSQAQQKAAPGRVATRNAHRKENVVPGHQNAAKTANEEAEVNWTVISGAKQPVNSAVNVTGAHGDELDESSIRSNGASRTKSKGACSHSSCKQCGIIY